MSGGKLPFYQIHLYSKEKIEIFQNVFWHKIYFKNGEQYSIGIKYSSSKNMGCSSVSTRPIDECYKIDVIDEPEFEPSGPNPGDKKIIMYGAGKTITWIPGADKWE